MRILSFTLMWPKLEKQEFTTFRCERRDKDWQLGELVQVYFKARSPNRKKLGVAEIVGKERRRIIAYTGLSGEEEAIDDGFSGWDDMLRWLYKAHKRLPEEMNKLTIKWLEKLG